MGSIGVKRPDTTMQRTEKVHTVNKDSPVVNSVDSSVTGEPETFHHIPVNLWKQWDEEARGGGDPQLLWSALTVAAVYQKLDTLDTSDDEHLRDTVAHVLGRVDKVREVLVTGGMVDPAKTIQLSKYCENISIYMDTRDDTLLQCVDEELSSSMWEVFDRVAG